MKKQNNRFTYKEKTFELMELKEIGTNKVYDIVAIFEVIKQEDYDSYNFVNYFYGVSDKKEELKSIATSYIDDYIKQCQLNELLLKLKKAYTNFKEDFNANNNTKGSLDDLEYAQSDLLEFVDKNL